MILPWTTADRRLQGLGRFNFRSVLVVPADVTEMADTGVRTVYLQAARLDERSPGASVYGDLADPRVQVLIGQVDERARIPPDYARDVTLVGRNQIDLQPARRASAAGDEATGVRNRPAAVGRAVLRLPQAGAAVSENRSAGAG